MRSGFEGLCSVGKCIGDQWSSQWRKQKDRNGIGIRYADHFRSRCCQAQPITYDSDHYRHSKWPWPNPAHVLANRSFRNSWTSRHEPQPLPPLPKQGALTRSQRLYIPIRSYLIKPVHIGN